MNELRILPKELKKKIENREEIFLLDVRNPEETELANIAGSFLIPLSELKSRISEIPNGKEIITYCHYGNRSFEAAKILREHNLNAKSLVGGIDCWSRFIDHRVPQY